MVVTRRQSTTPIPPVASRTNSSTNTSRLKDKSAGASPLKASATAGMQGTGPERRPASNGHADNPRAPVVGPQSLADIKFDDVGAIGVTCRCFSFVSDRFVFS